MAYFTNHKVYIPKFTTTEVAGVTFGGFEACKYPCSQPNATAAEGSPDVAHSGVAGSVPGISRAGLPVWDYVIFPQAMIACCNMGKGYHLTSAFERASLAFLAQKTATMPHGSNSNLDPPSDITFTSEIGMLDKHLHAEQPTYHRALPGTGPNTWAHNHMGSGVFDLNGLVWEWVLMMMSTNGYARVPANLDVTYTGSPYGRGTITGSGTATPTLTCDGSTVNWLKQWTADEFNGLDIYIAEAGSGAGVLYSGIVDTTASTIILANGAAPGDGVATFSVFRTVATDITTGMTTGNKILTLRNSDADLKAFGIPLTSDGTGSPVYGNDIFYYDKAAERAALWGGTFNDVLNAGVFALGLSYAPSHSLSNVGFRACKAL